MLFSIFVMGDLTKLLKKKKKTNDLKFINKSIIHTDKRKNK